MGIMNFFGALGNGIFGFIFKIMFMMLAIVFLLAMVVALVIYWPFTIALCIGLLLSPIIYRRLNRHLALRLPKFFYHDFQDLMVTLNHGEDQIARKQLDLNNKTIGARKHLEEMLIAVNSLEEQYKEIKAKRTLGTLFKKPMVELNPRAAKALEMELGKPKWAQYVDKMNKNGSNGDWEKYKSVPDPELEMEG